MANILNAQKSDLEKIVVKLGGVIEINDTIEDVVEFLEVGVESLMAEYQKVKKLQLENKKLREGLGFYADINNYGTDGDICRPTGNTVYDIILNDFDRSFIKNTDYAGKRAREILKELTTGG